MRLLPVTPAPLTQTKLNFEEDLDKWIDAAPKDEKPSRIKAKNKMLEFCKGDSYSISFKELQLTSLPPGLASLKNLSELDLSFNRLTSLTAEIGFLENLTALYLHFNCLTSFPPEITSLKKLLILALRGNQLDSIPPEIKSLEDLRFLDLSCNQFSSFPLEITSLAKLDRLYLNENNLVSIPEEITSLKNLKALNLSDNRRLEEVSALKKLPRLREIDLNRTTVSQNAQRLLELPIRLDRCKEFAESAVDLSFIQNLPPNEKAAIANWLSLGKYTYYEDKRASTAVCEMLAALKDNQEFKDFFLVIAGENKTEKDVDQSFEATYALFKLFSSAKASLIDKLTLFAQAIKSAPEAAKHQIKV
jgi:hypothetical protein